MVFLKIRIVRIASKQSDNATSHLVNITPLALTCSFSAVMYLTFKSSENIVRSHRSNVVHGRICTYSELRNDF